MRRLILIVSICFIAIAYCDAQFYSEKKREIGLNMSTIINQIIPFKESFRQSGPFAMSYRSGRDNRFFSFQVGAQVFNERFETDNINFVNIAIGFHKRFEVTERLSYTLMYDAIVSGGSFNEPNDINSDEASVGAGIGLSLEYKIVDKMHISTQSTLFLGQTDDFFRFHLIPPLGIFLNVRL